MAAPWGPREQAAAVNKARRTLCGVVRKMLPGFQGPPEYQSLLSADTAAHRPRGELFDALKTRVCMDQHARLHGESSNCNLLLRDSCVSE